MKVFSIAIMSIGFFITLIGGCMLDSESLEIPAAVCIIGIILLGFGTVMAEHFYEE